jgi:hypothetical protein
MILLISLFTLSHSISLLSEDLIHPKAYVISKDNPLKTIQEDPIPECPEPEVQYELEVVPLIWSIYRPEESDLKTYGVLLTQYAIYTKCWSPWIGTDTQTRENEYPIDILTPVEQLISFYEAKFGGNFEFINPQYSGEEVFEQELFDCPTIHGTSYRTTTVIKAKVVSVLWSPSGHLVSPYVNRSCSSMMGHCYLGRHSLLLFKPSSLSSKCPSQVMATFSGYGKVKEGKILSLTSQKFDWESSPSYNQNQKPDYICSYGSHSIFSTIEGHLISIFHPNGSDYFTEMRDNTLLRNRWNRGKRSVIPEILNPKFFIQHSSSSAPPTNTFKTTNRPESPTTTEMNWENFLPKMNLPVGGPKNESDQPKRNKRATYYDYPETQREMWMLEHSSWGVTELKGNIAQLKKESLDAFKITEREFCEAKRNRLIVARSLIPLTGVPYLTKKLKTRSFLIHPAQKNLVYRTGAPVESLYWDPNPVFCNNSLRVTYNNKPGWILNDIGVVIPAAELNGSCYTKDTPSSFLIPTFKRGSYDIVTKTYLAAGLSSIISSLSNPIPPLHFIPITIDDSLNRVDEIERSMSKNLFISEKQHEFTYLASEANSKADWSIWAITSWIIPSLVLIIVLFIVSRVILILDVIFSRK